MENFLASNKPLFVALGLNLAIIFSTLFTTIFYLLNNDVALELANTWQNFPLGLVTAIFTPDVGVFKVLSPLTWWELDSLDFMLFFAAFIVFQSVLGRRERSVRIIFYSMMVLVLAVAGDLYFLLTYGSTIGPSGAFFASLGIMVGFGLITAIASFSRGMEYSRRISGDTRFTTGTFIAGLILLLSFIFPGMIFNIAPSSENIAYQLHIFCFYSGIGTSMLFGWQRRSSLFAQPAVVEPAPEK